MSASASPLQRWPLRFLCGALLFTLGGAALAQGTPRWAVAGGLMLALALGLAWPRRVPAPVQDPPPPPQPALAARLQAQLELLPVAAWVQDGDSLQPLSNRARRLLAPGHARDAQALRAELAERARGARPGLMAIDTERGVERWQLALQPLQMDGRAQTLLALQPLERALEAEHLQAWEQLVRVLTHEIMGSLTPIRSLAQSALDLVDEPGHADELRLALDTVAQRAEGLHRFVADYRRVSHTPPPQMAPVDLQALLGRVQAAVAARWAARGGAVHLSLAEPGLRLQADAAQLEQALLNLVRNAETATRDVPRPELWVDAALARGGRLRITVRDNGCGVPPGLEQQIFLPFFSATEGGSGIGLTMVRQLVHGMGGRVRHVRPLGGGAAFVMSF